MAASDLINLPGLIDDAKCFALVRQHRWPEGAGCPVCGSGAVILDGHDDAQPCRQRYRCKTCSGCFDDLTGLDAASRHLPPGDRYAMVLAGHHQPPRVWVLCLYFMGLNLSNWCGSIRLLLREKRLGGGSFLGTGRSPWSWAWMLRTCRR